MYRCRECDSLFDEPEYHEVCWEAEYGVLGMFPDTHTGTITVCPFCGSPIYLEADEIDDDIDA